jgi:hypothetical protein
LGDHDTPFGDRRRRLAPTSSGGAAEGGDGAWPIPPRLAGSGDAGKTGQKKRPKEPFEAEQPGREATLLPSGGGCRSWNDGSCDSPSPEPRKQDRDCSRCLPSRSLAPSGKENDSLRPPGRQGSYPRTSRHASEIVHEVPADLPRAVDNCPPSWWRPTAIPAGAARRQRCPSAATFARPPCSPRRGLPPAARYGREASL